MPIPSGVSTEKVVILHYHGDAIEPVVITPVVNADGTMRFVVDGFSTFVVANDTSENSNNGNNNMEDTGNSGNNGNDNFDNAGSSDNNENNNSDNVGSSDNNGNSNSDNNGTDNDTETSPITGDINAVCIYVVLFMGVVLTSIGLFKSKKVIK